MPETVSLDPKTVELDPATITKAGSVSLDPRTVELDPRAITAAPKLPRAEQDQEDFENAPLTPEEEQLSRFVAGRETPGVDFGPTLRGGGQIIEGARKLAPVAKAALSDIGRTQLAGAGHPLPGKPATTPELLRQGAAGVHQVLGGAFEAATPAIAAGAVAAPVPTAITLAAGIAGQTGVEAGLNALGLPPEYSAVVGDLAGVVAGATALNAAARAVLRARVQSVLQDRLNADFRARQDAERQNREYAAQPRQIEGEVGEPAPAAQDVQDADFQDLGPRRALPPATTVEIKPGDVQPPPAAAAPKPKPPRGPKPNPAPGAPAPAPVAAQTPAAAAPQATGDNPDSLGFLNVGAMGSGIVDSMYDHLWSKVLAGDVKELGKPSAVLQAAKLARDNGGMKSIQDFKSLVADYNSIPHDADFQARMRSLVEKYSPQPEPAAAPTPAAAPATPTNIANPATPGDIGDKVQPPQPEHTIEDWAAALSRWAEAKGKKARDLKGEASKIGSAIAQRAMDVQLPEPAADLKVNDESYYAPDETFDTSEQAQALYTTVRQEQLGRHVALQMTKAALGVENLPDKLRNTLRNDLRTQEASLSNSYTEVENAFGPEVADRMRAEIEAAMKPIGRTAAPETAPAAAPESQKAPKPQATPAEAPAAPKAAEAPMPAAAPANAKQLPEPGEFHRFYNGLATGDVLQSPNGPVEITKVNAFNFQPIIPGPRGKWAPIGSASREVADLEAKLPDGSTRKFHSYDLKDYLYGKEPAPSAAAAPVELKPEDIHPAPAAAAQPQTDEPERLSRIAVTGKTYPKRLEIRRVGGEWNKDLQIWTLENTPENRAAVARIRGLGWRALRPEEEKALRPAVEAKPAEAETAPAAEPSSEVTAKPGGYVHLEARGAPTLQVPVKSAHEASVIVGMYRDQYGLGGSDMAPKFGNIYANDGTLVAHVSYNGRVWTPPTPDAPDGKLLEEATDVNGNTIERTPLFSEQRTPQEGTPVVGTPLVGELHSNQEPEGPGLLVLTGKRLRALTESEREQIREAGATWHKDLRIWTFENTLEKMDAMRRIRGVGWRTLLPEEENALRPEQAEEHPSPQAEKPPILESEKAEQHAAPEPQPAAEGTAEPVRAANSEALEEELPAAGGGTGEPTPSTRPRGKRSQPRKPRAGAGEGEGAQLEPGAGTGTGGVEEPARSAPRAANPESNRLEHDYRIPDGRTVSGSPEARAKANIRAIKLLRQLEEEGRPATAEEKDVLASYVGWGAVPQLFAGSTSEFEELQKELRGLLSDEEYEDAQRSTTNAHYTSDTIVDAMWAAMERLGAKPGMSWLEPAVGVGNFFGRQPEALLEGARRIGLDKDTLTGKIAKYLYPDSGIDIMPFEKAELPTDYFDAVISNVPFGNFGVHDATFRGKQYLTSSIHNYFFAKALTLVRPGGVVGFITSRYTMDAYEPAAIAFRKWIDERADFLGAVRLPAGAFRQNAGTEVITDLIFLRRRLPGAERDTKPWIETETRHLSNQFGNRPHEVNEYYHAHPEMILGKEGLKRGQFSALDYHVEGNADLKTIADALNKLPAEAFQAWKRSQGRPRLILREVNPEATGAKLGALFFDKDGKLYRKTGQGSAEPIETSGGEKTRIKGQLGIRDALQELLAAELKDAPEPQLKAMRQRLNKLYDAYVKTQGPLSSAANQKAMAGDPDAPLLVSLERRYSREDKSAEKAPIFERRMLQPARKVESVADAKDALYVTLNELGRIDWGRMQELTGRAPEQLQDDLKGIVFLDPKSETWQTAEEYLSGSVRAKLAEARKYAKVDKRFAENAKALEAAQPEDIAPGDIAAELGVTWVPLETYGEFAQDVLATPRPVGVHYVAGEWHLEHTPCNRTQWHTARVAARELLLDALNKRRTKVYDTIDNKPVLNQQETIAARTKQKEMQEHFNKWLFSDPERGARMARLYNDTQNDLRLRTFDGSHLTLPGMTRDPAVVRGGNLDPHQLAAVWRQISQPNVLLAHCVGAGKTFEMIAAGMELKRLGLIKRPMYVVPNATLTGWQQQFNALYPQARVLVFSEKDLEKKRRQQVMAQIATGDWDAVIVPQSSFQFLRTGDEIFQEHYDKLARELEEQISEAEAAGMDTRMIKRMEKAKERLLTSLLDRRNAERQDLTVTWEQLGIDQLFVDESHNYKKLGFATKQGNIAGIDNQGNQMTFDLLMKMRYTQKHGRGIVFATGTPVTNTMGELFSLMRYLVEPELEARGMGRFDEWASNFGRTVDVFEPKVEGGGYQMKARFAQFVNIPELAQMFRSFADVITPDMVNLPRPALKGGARIPIESELNEGQRDYLNDLRGRAAEIRRNPRDAMPDNMLAVYTDAQKMALDLRMVDPSALDDPQNRLNKAADKIAEIWRETKATKGTQLVLSDLGKPSEAGGSRDFSPYDELIRKLIERGIPAKEIAHIYQAKNKAQRAKLFDQVDRGEVRVLLGSTPKLGVGVNVQSHLAALHHLDIPHRPADLEQREGRILRQGNQNPEVAIYYYLTRGSLDEAKFANVVRKAKFINQVMQGKSTVRTAEDVGGGMVPSLEQFQAMASGDPRVMRKLEVDSEVDRLGALHAAWRNEVYRNRQELAAIPRKISVAESTVAAYEDLIKARQNGTATWKVHRKTWDEKGHSHEISEALHAAIAAVHDEAEKTIRRNIVTIGSAGGIDLSTDGSYLYLGDHPRSNIDVRDADPKGIVQRVHNFLKSLDERIGMEQAILARAKKEQADLQAAISKDWPYEAQYKALREEQAKLIKELGADKGDDAALVAEEGEEIRDTSVAAEEGEGAENEDEEEERASGERGAAPMLGDLAQWIADRFQEKGPKANYSGLGALEDRFVRNLSQLESASAAAHTAAVRAASSRAQSATILRSAIPAILKALQGGEFTWPEVRLALVQSRLEGIRTRWYDFADQVERMRDQELQEAFDDHLAGILEAIEGKKGIAQNVAQTAAAAADAGDWQTLRSFLAQTFGEAGANVATIMDPDWFKAVTDSPHVKAAVQIYKQLVEKPMADNHALNEGVFSTALGPLDTYYPLIPLNADDEQIHRGGAPGRRLPYHKPRNQANAFATGLSPRYDVTMEGLRDRLAAAVRANDKAALLKTLEEVGLLRKIKPGQPLEDDIVKRRGVEYEGERVELSPARIIIKDGKAIHTPASVGIIPRWLARELRPILEREQFHAPTVLDRILGAVNTFALAGPADFVFHSSNLFGTLVANTPFLEDSIGGKLASAPLLKKFTALVKVLRTDPTTPEAAADLIEMAKLGLVPDRYASETFSKQAAEELGATRKRFSFGPALYGPKGIDVRARLVMYRLAKAVNPGATPQQLYHFVNQLGNYVPALQGEIERAFKRSGFSPFYTAGSTMLRNGINAWLGTSPLPKDSIGLRMWQQITGGAIGTLILWALTYKAMTGRYPWEDKRAKLLAIPAPERFRRSATGVALWGKGPETGYIQFGFFNPLIMRGGRALGIPGAFETHQLGGSFGQSVEAAQRDVLNAFAHPTLGPAARALFVGATGEEPYVTGLRDRRGNVSLSFYPAIPPKTRQGLPALGARMLAAAREMNAFYGNLGEATGMLGTDRGEKGNHYLRMMIDLAAPGLVGNATNPYKRAEALRTQRTK